MENSDNNDFNYVQEKIKSKNKKRLKKAIIVACSTVVCAVVFGFLARLVFVASEGAVNKLLGITPIPSPTPYVEDKRNKVDLPRKNVSPTETVTPSAVPVVAPVEVSDTPSPITDPTPTDAPSPTPSVPNQQTADNDTSALQNYIKMMSEMRSIADEAYSSLVRIYSITTGVNWMDESVETRREVSGLIVADNGVELLILADYSLLSDADRIEVELGDKSVAEGKLLSFDKDTGLVVVAVPLDSIPEKLVAEYSYATLGDSSKLYEGQPVIAIGRPNGYYGAVLFGFISKTGLNACIVDGEVEFINTDIEFTGDSDGVILTLDGNVVGIIGATARSDSATMQCVSINSMKNDIVKLLNADPIAYFGIKAENMPEDILAGLELDHGIYVNEVIAGSPAHSAGIKKGDIITSLRHVEILDDGITADDDSVQIKSLAQFYEYILNTDAGQVVEPQIFRSSMREDPHMIVHVWTINK